MLSWLCRYNIFCFLDNHQYNIAPHEYECLAGADALDSVSSDDLSDIDHFILNNKDWAFGHLSYDLKNVLFNLKSVKTNNIGFPLYYFFRPRIVLKIRNNELHIQANDPESIYHEILSEYVERNSSIQEIYIQQKLSREEYLYKINKLKEHIVRGDCYEINFCQEFFSEHAEISPLDVYEALSQVSPNPFSCFYRLNDKYLLCASPERFLSKQKDRLLSQPMKGTIKRDLKNKVNDTVLKNELLNSAKDRSENVMVVDLVRHDLSKVCIPGTVHVKELFGVNSFPQVYQMVSTISGLIKKDLLFSQIISSLFPMGSMTGAPKIRVMELIEAYETSSRGLFSGSVGYISPEGDFDFNVVIRSILYNATKKYLSFFLGSGITFYSDPEKEWEECMLKGIAIKKVLTSKVFHVNLSTSQLITLPASK